MYLSDYNMGNRDLPEIYAQALGPAALRLGHTLSIEAMVALTRILISIC